MGTNGIVIASASDSATTSRLISLLSAELKTESFDADGKFVIRWGSTYRIKNAKSCLNTAVAVRRTKHKLDMLDMLREAGVIVPSVIDKPPCVARWNGGSRGEGIRFCKKKKDMEQAEEDGAGSFLEWIDVKREFRVHIFKGLLISLCEKKKKFGGNKLIRNVSHGWEFCNDAKLNAVDAVDLISSSLSAVMALKLDFGAVDIAMSKQNIPVVFEVNTAPGLNDRRANLYALSIKKWINSFA